MRHRLINLTAVAFVLALAISIALPIRLQAAAPAVTLSVEKTGELKINLGGKLVASGRWSLLSGGWQPMDADQILPGALVSTTVVQDDAAHATVTDTYASAKSVSELKLIGEDLSIVVHLQNLDSEKSLKNLSFQGPTFHFGRNASGTLHAWHSSYVTSLGDRAFHPSLTQPLGAVHAHDDQFGFSVFSSSEFDDLSFFNADFGGDGIIPQECRVDFYTRRSVPPGKTADMDASIRVSNDMSIPHLFENYKKTYNAHFAKPLFEADSRPVAQFTATDKEHITPTNPLGYNGDFRRLDTDKGTRAYVAAIAPWLYKAEALGIIFWAPGGFKMPMYPPDFDEFPKSVQDNIPTLVAGFKEYQARVGLCARCGDGVIREAGKDPVVYRLNAQEEGQMKTLMARFDHATGMGFDLFYLDSFGADGLNDLEILKKIRTKVGPKVLLYTEFCTDLSLAYADHYCEWNDNSILWNSDEQFQVMRFLRPDSTWLALSRSKLGALPPALVQMGLTPMVPDSAVSHLPSKRRFK